MFDVDVIVIDPEKEYEYMSEPPAANISISRSIPSTTSILSTCQFQPRTSPALMCCARTSSTWSGSSASCWRIVTEEDAMIDRAISETYALKDITPSLISARSSHLCCPILNWSWQEWKAPIRWYNA